VQEVARPHLCASEAQLREGAVELGGRRADSHVAREGDRETAPGRRPVHRGDQWLRNRAQVPDEVAVDLLKAELLLDGTQTLLPGRILPGGLQVRAGAEPRARAGQDDDSRVQIALELGESAL
jgi:hypothetical protein